VAIRTHEEAKEVTSGVFGMSTPLMRLASECSSFSAASVSGMMMSMGSLVSSSSSDLIPMCSRRVEASATSLSESTSCAGSRGVVRAGEVGARARGCCQRGVVQIDF
jgi:hypothetical protein